MPSKLENVKFTATIREESDELGPRIVVEAFANDLGLDRPRIVGWGLKKTHRALGERLVRAIEAGVVLTPEEIRRDVHNESYLVTRCTVLGRTLNADLRRLGF